MPKMHWTELNDAPANEIFKGIRVRPLWQDHDVIKAMVVEFDPGSCWEGDPDVHDSGSEEVYVASGVFNDGERDYPAGTIIHMPKGSSHIPQSKTGCTLFVFYPEGVPM